MKATRNDMGGGNTIDLSWIRSLRADPSEACESLSDAPTRQAVQRDLGTGALEWGVAVAHRTTAYMIEELPVYGGDPAGEWLLGRAVESTVLASLRALVLDDIDLLWPAEEPAAAYGLVCPPWDPDARCAARDPPVSRGARAITHG